MWLEKKVVWICPSEDLAFRLLILTINFFCINFMTSQEVPLLSLEQIQQLAGMVCSIQTENGSDLEELLSERVEIEHTSIMTLYNLAAEEWTKKQKIVDNLCHFALTIMNSIQLLWEQNFKLQNQLKQAETTVQQLQRTLVATNDQNDNFKETIEETHLQIEALTEERNKVQEYCRSLSCIELPQTPLEPLQKQLSAVFESEELKHRQEVERLLEEKMTEIESLKEEKQKLSDQYLQLKEEQELTRMEMELAEIAVQQALTYKNSYLEMVSQGSQISALPIENHRREEKPTFQLQQEHRFLGPKSSNSLGDDLSELCPLNSHLVHFEHPFQHSEEEQQPQLMKMKSKEDRKTNECSSSPFRRKLEPQQDKNHDIESFGESTIMQKHESVIIMQSSLDVTISSEDQERSKINCSNKLELKSNKRKRPFQLPIYQPVLKADMRRKKGVNRTAAPAGVPIYINESESSSQGGALGRLYNLLSTKLVTNRIRKH